MELFIKILIYTHASFGGIGLLSGGVAVIVKKGGYLHRNAGKLFSFSMVASSIVAAIVSRMPGHENIFLFLIGIFTVYMVFAGNRALTFKNKAKQKPDMIDKCISGTMLLTSAVMIILGITGLFRQISDVFILFIFFGTLGALLSIKDFHNFKKFASEKNLWLKSHIGRMTGALIASVTAYIITGLHIDSILAWILPTVIGTSYIIFWGKKIEKTSVPRYNKLKEQF